MKMRKEEEKGDIKQAEREGDTEEMVQATTIRPKEDEKEEKRDINNDEERERRPPKK